MRWLALLALLASPSAFAVYCYGGTTVSAPTLEDCPPRISNVVITPTAGGFDLDYTSEGGLTLEIAVEAGHDQKCPGCPYATGTTDKPERRVNYARLDDQAIKNATGMALGSQQSNPTAGDYSISITGLGNSAAYSVHLLPIDSADDSYGSAWQRNVTTLSSGGNESLVGAQRFNRSGGSDLADGLTHATAWETGLNCESGMATSVDCRFLSGESFGPIRLDITHSGTPSDYAVIGCYKWTGTEEVGCDHATDPRFKILGDMNEAQILARTLDWNDTTGYTQPSKDTGQVRIFEQDYVMLEHMHVTLAYGGSVHIKGAGVTAAHHATVSHIIMESVESSYNGLRVSINAEAGAHNVVFRNSSVHNYNRCESDVVAGNPPSPAIGGCGGSGWPAAGAWTRSHGGMFLVENVETYEGYGEGWNCNESEFCIFRYTRSWKHRSNAKYADAGGGMVLEGNIAYYHHGTIDGVSIGALHGGEYKVGSEDSQGAPEYAWISVIRNNISVDMPQGHTLGMEAANEAAGYQVGMAQYGNTVVHTDIGYNATNLGAINVLAGSEAAQNLYYAPEGVSCQSNSAVDHHHNFANPTPADVDCQGPGDGTGNPQFPRVYATFANATGSSNPVDPNTDLCLGVGSDAIGVGDASLKSEYSSLLQEIVTDGAWIRSQFQMHVPDDWDLWARKLYYDYNMNERTSVFAGAVGPCS